MVIATEVNRRDTYVLLIYEQGWNLSGDERMNLGLRGGYFNFLFDNKLPFHFP